jgi:beta-mannosidase
MMKKINLLFFILILFMHSKCRKVIKNETIFLHNNWQFAIKEDTLFRPAKIPGYVHTDLIHNNVIDSLYWGKNPEKYNFVGDTGWVYRTTIQLSPEKMDYKNKQLIFEGVDTYADIFLNDSLILSTENMFLEYKADISDQLHDGKNELEVHFKSPIKEAQKIIDDYPFYTKEHAQADANNYRKFIRKAQYQFGWDWAPPLIPTGLYRPVKLLLYDNSYITDVYFRQKQLTDEIAKLDADIAIESDCSLQSKLQVRINDQVIKQRPVNLKKGTNKIRIPFTIENPKRWWPNGLGDQYLYKATISLTKNSQIIDNFCDDIGLRTIEFVNKFDVRGKSYYFKVNDVPVFMKGANYIPLDAMIPSVTKERYNEMLNNCVEANFNMLRIWGGGIYESDYFYELCDRKGILIYQDFMFASNMPPADSAFVKNVEKEAIYQVKRLRNHPSIALWAGGNEVESAWFEGFMPDGYPQEVYTKDFKKIFDDLLPGVVEKYHSEISYVRSSPTTGTDSILVNTPGYGDTHAWGVWFSKIDFQDAQNNRLSRFISEYGFIGYPPYTSMQRYIPKSEMDTSSAVFKFHDAYEGIQNTIRDLIDRYYPQPNNLQEFVYISGIMQAEAMRISNEIYRRNKPFCMGALLWQYNDVWPVASWSMVDYYGQWKPIMYRTKESFAPIILSTAQKNDSIYVYCVNDEPEDYNCKLNLNVQDFSGEKIWTDQKSIEIKKNASQMIYSESIANITDNNPLGNLLVQLSLQNGKEEMATKLHYFKRCKNLNLTDAKLWYKITNQSQATIIELKANALLKNLYLVDKKGDLHFSNNYFDLLPGKPVQIKINKKLAPVQLNKRLSFMSLNEVVGKNIEIIRR